VVHAAEGIGQSYQRGSRSCGGSDLRIRAPLVVGRFSLRGATVTCCAVRVELGSATARGFCRRVLAVVCGSWPLVGHAPCVKREFLVVVGDVFEGFEEDQVGNSTRVTAPRGVRLSERETL
jgi:hypothetical protein